MLLTLLQMSSHTQFTTEQSGITMLTHLILDLNTNLDLMFLKSLIWKTQSGLIFNRTTLCMKHTTFISTNPAIWYPTLWEGLCQDVIKVIENTIVPQCLLYSNLGDVGRILKMKISHGMKFFPTTSLLLVSRS